MHLHTGKPACPLCKSYKQSKASSKCCHRHELEVSSPHAETCAVICPHRAEGTAGTAESSIPIATPCARGAASKMKIYQCEMKIAMHAHTHTHTYAEADHLLSKKSDRSWASYVWAASSHTHTRTRTHAHRHRHRHRHTHTRAYAGTHTHRHFLRRHTDTHHSHQQEIKLGMFAILMRTQKIWDAGVLVSAPLSRPDLCSKAQW